MEMQSSSDSLPMVSVVTICLNAEKSIRAAIESVLGQDYPKIEYIIIDGGSTDRTLDIVNSYHNRIATIISEKDEGIADAFNKGVRAAKGELIGFMNADDVYLKDSLSLLVKRFLESHRRPDLLYADAVCVEKGEALFITRALPLKDSNVLTPFTCHQAILAKRSLFDVVGGFDTRYRYGMDYDWVLRSLKSGARFEALTGVPVVKYSMEGVSAKNSLKALFEFRRIALANGMGTLRVNAFYVWKVAKAVLQQVLFEVGLKGWVVRVKAKYKKKYRPIS